MLAFTGPNGRDVREANRLRGRGDFDGALKLYATVLAKTKHPHAYEYIVDTMKRTGWQKTFHSGAWTRLDTQEGLWGWVPVKGHWTAQPDGSLVGRSTNDGALIWCNVDFGQAIELRATVEFLPSTYSMNTTGLVFGNQHGGNWYNCTVAPQNKKASLGENWGVQVQRDAPIRGANKLLVRRIGGKVSLTVNGKKIYDSQGLPGYHLAPGGYVGIFNRNTGSGVKFRIRDVQIRKLQTR